VQKEVKDGSNPTEYLDSELHDVVAESVIRQIYRTFMVSPLFFFFFFFHFGLAASLILASFLGAGTL